MVTGLVPTRTAFATHGDFATLRAVIAPHELLDAHADIYFLGAFDGILRGTDRALHLDLPLGVDAGLGERAAKLGDGAIVNLPNALARDIERVCDFPEV